MRIFPSMTGELEATAEAASQAGPSSPILIAGHSHMCALIADIKTADTVVHTVSESPHVLALHAPWPRPDDYWEKLKANSGGTHVAVIWGGNEHNLHYFFQGQHPFEVVSRHVHKLIPTVSLIPRRQVRDNFKKSSIADLALMLVELAKGPAKSISVIGTPPPKKDNEALRKILISEPVLVKWTELEGQKLEDVKITPPYVRLKLWFLLQEMLAEAARQVGGKFIPVPRKVQDEDGFLQPQYWHYDVTHANSLYGEVMLRRIVEELS
jgi:hypothetical protein